MKEQKLHRVSSMGMSSAAKRRIHESSCGDVGEKSGFAGPDMEPTLLQPDFSQDGGQDSVDSESHLVSGVETTAADRGARRMIVRGPEGVVPKVPHTGIFLTSELSGREVVGSS